MCQVEGARGDVFAAPSGLPDSHIVTLAEHVAGALGGLEFEPAFEHDDGSGLSIVAGPAAETCADPACVGYGSRICAE